MPKLLNLWHTHWQREINRKEDSEEVIDYFKKRAWEHLQVFIAGYDQADDVISMAYNIDRYELYPMVVIAMMSLYQWEVCIIEYIEIVMYSTDWNVISLDKGKDDCYTFFIREWPHQW